ncbi:MAG: hypothetical protein U0527_14615 [Candidatus Eisenbacteria bacterium]
MKVLDLLKKAGIIAVEGEEPLPRKGTDKPSAEHAAKDAAKPPARADKPTVNLPPPPTSAEMAPLASRELTVDFTQIYAALKIPTPAHGWNVDKVAAALANPQFQSLDANTRKAALLAMLAASNAPPQDIVEDAARRDQALDAYEQFARRKLADRLEALRQAIAEEDERIRLATQAIGQHKEALAKEEASFEAWLGKKIEQEEGLVRVVALLADPSIISVGSVEPTVKKSPEGKGDAPEGHKKS